MSRPPDPYRRLATAHLEPGGDDAPDRADPEFWGETRSRGGRGPRPARRRIVEGPLDRLRDVMVGWRNDARVGLVVLVAIALVGGVVWYRVGVGSGAATPRATPAQPRSAPARAATTGGNHSPDPTEPAASGERMLVHVAGAVVRPGVVELAMGSRVIDAIEAAGGGLAEADLDRLNLAAKVVDGQRVLVARVGDPPESQVSGGVAPGGVGAAPGAPGAGPLNLNTATLDQLDGLPGIGPTIAAAILAERDRRGAFKSVNELRDVHGIGEKRFADLRDLVAV